MLDDWTARMDDRAKSDPYALLAIVVSVVVVLLLALP